VRRRRDWAIRFNDVVKRKIARRNHAPLIDCQSVGPDGLLSIPEVEHFHPLLHVLATRQPEEPAEIFADTTSNLS
jgi:aromatic ring-opening dioxygenase catalytic subunit (LigB family)